ncbi:MAG: hypothetical protein ACE5GL_00600 [Calditrichia bacterium]
MLTNQIQNALAQVKELQQTILEKQRFKGYSGRARAIGGTLALIAAAIMASPSFPQVKAAHVTGWGIVFMIGFLLNFGMLIHWFLFDPKVKRDIRRLKPPMDAFPALFVGVVLTIALIFANQHQLLFGVWMSLFGLANLAARHVLPRKIWIVGVFYVVCGVIFLSLPNVSFYNPWPVGLVFFVGEWAGGIVLHFDSGKPISIKNVLIDFLKFGEKGHVHEH